MCLALGLCMCLFACLLFLGSGFSVASFRASNLRPCTIGIGSGFDEFRVGSELRVVYGLRRFGVWRGFRDFGHTLGVNGLGVQD